MSRLERWMTHAANHRTCYGFGIILTAVHLVLVAERVYRYRHYGGWVVTARASGQCLHFDCALVLLLTLRRSITWLRAKGMAWLLPLDRHVYFHKMIGWLICIFSVVHTIAHVINYGLASRRHGGSLGDYLFDKTVGWIPGLVTPTGFALLFILVIMGLCSHRMVRKSGRFELFYWTHLLCLPFFPLIILHGGNVWKWLVGPLAIFGVEMVYRVWIVCCSDRGRGRIIALHLLPNQVVGLRIERPLHFEFNAGDYVYVNIPQVARFEWHPFTISSAPEDEDYLTLHVRVAGGWTGRLYSLCQRDAERLERKQSLHKIAQAQLSAKLSAFPAPPPALAHPDSKGQTVGEDNLAYQPDQHHPSQPVSTQVTVLGDAFSSRLEMPILLDGPYSGSSTRAWNCRHALFIAGGIGVTPFASILQSLVSRYQMAMMACPHCLKPCCTNVPASLGKLRHVEFLWINRDLMSFQWFLELLLDLDREQAVRGSVMSRFLDIQLYQTGAKPLPDSHQPCSNCRDTLVNPSAVTATTAAVQPYQQVKVVDETEATTGPLEAGTIAPAPPLPPTVVSRCSYCTIRQMQHLLRYGRPVWDEVFREVALRCGGRVSVYYCGPAAMGRVVMGHCKKFGFTFTKEIS